MEIRQPIVGVMGHVDHGKTSLLDRIRKTDVAKREAGLITQHIGATEVPLDTIHEICGDLLGGRRFTIPGLLFIDTPGHEAFITLRRRGGALADMGVLVIDIREGFKPQTVESLKILREAKLPFVVAANKVDLLEGWRDVKGNSFLKMLEAQHPRTLELLDDKIYRIAGRLVELGYPAADRFDRISDFTRSIAVIPVSAKFGTGIAELLMVLVGIAQKFLEEELKPLSDVGEGTILEIKDEKGLGLTLDFILYQGKLRIGDTVVFGSANGPKMTKVRAILRPKPLDEIRDPRDRFMRVKEVTAACGVKISAPELEGALAGAPLRVVHGSGEKAIEEAKAAVAEETELAVELSPEGVVVVADAIGSCEAISHECKIREVPIRRARIGDVSRKDVMDALSGSTEALRCILAFNTRVLDEAREEALRGGVKILEGKIIYALADEYVKHSRELSRKAEEEARAERPYPAKLLLLPGHIFRASKPAVVGVRVLAGKVKSGVHLVDEKGKRVGTLKSIQRQNETVREAQMGDELAISIEGGVAGRNLHEDMVMHVELSVGDFKKIDPTTFTLEEREALEELVKIKRREDRFWGL